MRCYLHALLICILLAVFSSLYVLNQLASSLDAQDERTLGKPQGVPQSGRHATGERLNTKTSKDERMHLAVVACGPRLEETLVMLKSAVLFSTKLLHFHIFAEDHLHESFKEALDSWPAEIQPQFNTTTYPITFPRDNAAEWKKLFKPCASQRLFLPLILKDVDSVLYVDTDILFLNPVDELWALLSRFDASQLAAMAPEHEEPRIGWYNRFARHPYYGATGVNSGVMLMNMTRIREKRFKNDMTSVPLRWDEMLMPLLQKYKLNITWGDQDLLNIIFHHNPESLYVFPCLWNYRPDHCIYGSNCQPAEQEGVFILHGNRGVYHDDKQPAFRAVYEAIQKQQEKRGDIIASLGLLGEDVRAAIALSPPGCVSALLQSLEHSLTNYQHILAHLELSGAVESPLTSSCVPQSSPSLSTVLWAYSRLITGKLEWLVVTLEDRCTPSV